MFPGQTFQPDTTLAPGRARYATHTEVSICQKFPLRVANDAFGELIGFFTALNREIGSTKGKRDTYYMLLFMALYASCVASTRAVASSNTENRTEIENRKFK